MIKLTTFLQTYLLYLLSFVLGQHGVTASWYTVKFRLMDPSVSLTSRHFLCLELLPASSALAPHRPMYLQTTGCFSHHLSPSHKNGETSTSEFLFFYSHITLMPRSSRTRHTGRRHILGSLSLAKLGKTGSDVGSTTSARLVSVREH